MELALNAEVLTLIASTVKVPIFGQEKNVFMALKFQDLIFRMVLVQLEQPSSMILKPTRLLDVPVLVQQDTTMPQQDVLPVLQHLAQVLLLLIVKTVLPQQDTIREQWSALAVQQILILWVLLLQVAVTANLTISGIVILEDASVILL